MTTQTTAPAHEALGLRTLGRVTIDGIQYVAYTDGAFRHVVTAEHYDTEIPVPGDDEGAAYDAWCRHSAAFASDALSIRVARDLGLVVIHSAQDGLCSRLDTGIE